MSNKSEDIKEVLIIQTAFIGDVILATPIIEFFSQYYPNAKIDFLLRKGNEKLFESHPHLREIIIWDKNNRYKSLFKIANDLNKRRDYDYLINLQRFFSTGLFSAIIQSKKKIGFKKNPLSFLYDLKVEHSIAKGTHEVERNLKLLEIFNKDLNQKVKLYPSESDSNKVREYSKEGFITISPASVWFTKQLGVNKWIEFVNVLDQNLNVILLGGPADKELAEEIIKESNHPKILNLAGLTSFLETAALMQKAILNYTNDSAPMHIASSQNAPVCAVYCSTIPDFGFGPLSDFSKLVQVENLYCKPCGLHGHKTCPEGHFKCSNDLDINKLLIAYNDALIYRSKLTHKPIIDEIP